MKHGSGGQSFIPDFHRFLFFLSTHCSPTFVYEGRNLKGKTIAWVGDGNNVLHDLAAGSIKQGMNVHIATPVGYDPDAEDLPRGVLQEAHLERIAMFSSSDVWTPVDVDELERSAQHDARQYQVKGVTQWRRQNANNKRLEFRVRWRGFEDPKDDSWEPEEEVQLEPVLLSAAIELCERRQAKSADCAACLKRLRKHQGKKADASVEDVLGEVEYQPPAQRK